MKKWNMFAGVLVLTLFIGFANADDSEKTLFNDVCPVSGKAVDSAQTSDFTAEFCCEKCKAKFDKDPSKHLGKAAKGEAGKCIFNGKDATTSSTLTIGFCCENCKAKFDADPKAMIEKVKPAQPKHE